MYKFVISGEIFMYEVRFHGRGGQGAVTAANLLAIAAFKGGKYTQSFPFFGVERRGAPVMAFVRMDSEYIKIKQQVYEPDAAVVLDPSLLDVIDATEGLKNDSVIVINTKKDVKDFNFKQYVATVDATTIAINQRLGTKTAPIVNTAILGAYAKAMELFDKEGYISLEHIIHAVKEKAPSKKEENARAVEDAYEMVKT
jgi:2-oxoacid:acceptor oxidoreductase gamma subunit (pyruvate/2-ketoisovalerate family)